MYLRYAIFEINNVKFQYYNVILWTYRMSL